MEKEMCYKKRRAVNGRGGGGGWSNSLFGDVAG